MSDTITETVDAPEAPDVEERTTEDPRVTKANQEAARYRRELRETQAKLAEYEKAQQQKAEADKSEAERRAAAEQRATEAELRATRLEVAHEKGLTPAQAKRLVGDTREALEADAEEILRDFPAARAKSEPKAPKPDPSQGARSTAPTASVEAGASLYQQKHGKKS
ncbi:hypothetical protein ACQEVC_45540 [Plantactinospora sp. CA-294935]|uniref:hypothetical protein n=1 Tax=Plantactinospora sp. CA-294935 TaxID=3240012 RepID=UPI003D92DDF7